MDVETIQFSNLEELFNLQYESMVSQEYLFAWLDSHINWTTLPSNSYLFSGISRFRAPLEPILMLYASVEVSYLTAIVKYRRRKVSVNSD